MIQDGVSEARLEEMAPFSGDEATEVLSSLLQARNWQDDLARMIPNRMQFISFVNGLK